MSGHARQFQEEINEDTDPEQDKPAFYRKSVFAVSDPG
jgi:hypothetical protein